MLAPARALLFEEQHDEQSNDRQNSDAIFHDSFLLEVSGGMPR
ncbi:MAG: hypothetical protein RLY47_533 [Candidatus Parcubacteria bacterium]|jgi:hypothetical protein